MSPASSGADIRMGTSVDYVSRGTLSSGFIQGVTGRLSNFKHA